MALGAKQASKDIALLICQERNCGSELCYADNECSYKLRWLKWKRGRYHKGSIGWLEYDMRIKGYGKVVDKRRVVIWANKGVIKHIGE